MASLSSGSLGEVSRILLLSPEIRKQIYLHAGLVHLAEIHFLHGSRPAYLHRESVNYQYPTDLALLFQMPEPVPPSFRASKNLLTCTTFYAEVSEILYATNQFNFRITQPEDFVVIQNLRPQTLSRLRCVTIAINKAGCYTSTRGFGPCHNRVRPSSQDIEQADPVDRSDPLHDMLLCEWDVALKRLVNDVNPFKLRLRLLIDCNNYETASRLLKPLEQTQKLADCSIRLSTFANEALKDLARTTALHSTGRKHQHQLFFRYLDLPNEVRTRILEYTDLVTPLAEIEWSPKVGYRLNYSREYCGRPWQCPENFHHACQFRGCWQHDGNTGCFCNRHHAAFDFRCNCWRPPQPLFLACRGIRDDAERVFFRSNRFVIKPVDDWEISPQRSPCCLEAALFLTQAVRPSALCHLRYLEIVFPPFEDRYCLESGIALSHWTHTLDLIRDKLCHPMLTLHIYMPNHHTCGFLVSAYRRELSKDQGVAMLKTYLRILRPFSEWLDVKRLYLDMGWPWSWTAFGCDNRRDAQYFVQDKNRWTTDQIGETILGKDYERLNQGKDDLIPAQWRAREFAELHESVFEYDSPASDPGLMDARWKEILDDESLTLTRLFREE